jgi:hypothetical protein
MRRTRVTLLEVGFCILTISCAQSGASLRRGRIQEVAPKSATREDPSIKGDWFTQWVPPEGPRPRVADAQPTVDVVWDPPLVCLSPVVFDLLPSDERTLPVSAQKESVLLARVDWYGAGGALVVRVPEGGTVSSTARPPLTDRGSVFLGVRLSADITHLTVVNPTKARMSVRPLICTQASR